MIVTDNSNIVLDREYKEVFFRPAKVNVAIAVTILFLIWPMLALPCVIVEVLNRRKYSFVLLTIFMGYIAYLWPPTGDLYRHTLSYFEFKYSSSYKLSEYQEDYVMHILSFIFAKNGIPFEFVRFIFIVVSYTLMFRVLEDLGRKYSFVKENYRSFLGIFFFVVNFTIIVFGLRFGFGSVLMSYGVYLLWNSRYQGWCWCIIAFLVHYSLISVFILLILSRLIKLKNKKIAIISLLFFIFPMTALLDKVIMILPIPDIVKVVLTVYSSGYWGQEAMADRSLLYRLSLLISQIPVYYTVYCFLRDGKFRTICDSFLIIMVVFWSISSSSYEFFGRVTTFIIYPMVFYMAYRACRLRVIRRIHVTLILLVFSFLSSFYGMRREVSISDMSLLLYGNTYQIISHTYDLNWLRANVNSDGSAAKFY